MRPAIVLLLLCGCTGEVDALSGLLEPLRVPDGEFVPAEEVPARSGGPGVTSIEAASGIVGIGQQGRVLVGRVDEEAYAIGLRFAELGTGWWVRPVQDLDPMFPGERDFRIAYDVGGGAPPGRHVLELAAIDADGRRGSAFELEVCVRDDRVPDNLNTCDPTLKPPATVVVIEWDQPVDIDLVVETPAGKRIAWKSPTSADNDGAPIDAMTLKDPALGRLTRDSNAACVIDGRNSEAVVWQEPPASGDYLIFADLFEACGQSGALFSVVVYTRKQNKNGDLVLAETSRVTGSLVELQASGGAGPPLYVTSFESP
jgi:hypothetical protein